MTVDAFIAKTATMILVSKNFVFSFINFFIQKFFIVVQNNKENSCVACGKAKIKSYDIRDKKQLREIEGNITDPGLLLNRAINAIRFQQLHDQKYIEFLEKRGAALHKENQNLKNRVKEYEEKSRKRHMEEELQLQARQTNYADIRSKDSETPNFDYKQGVALRSDIGSEVLSQMTYGAGGGSGMRPQIDNRSLASRTEDENYLQQPK